MRLILLGTCLNKDAASEKMTTLLLSLQDVGAKGGQVHRRSVRIVLFGASRFIHESLKQLVRKQPISIVPLTDKSRPYTKSRQADITLVESHDASDSNLNKITQSSPTSKIVVTNADPDGANVLMLVRFGVVGFLLSDASRAEFLKTMFAVADGSWVLPQPIVRRLCEQLYQSGNSDKQQASLEDVHLTNREQQIVRKIVGKRNKEIASELDLSPDTVKSHVHTILQKLRCRNRSELVALSIKRGWI